MTRGCYAKNPNSMRQKIEDLLKEHGGMTISDLMDEPILQGYSKGGVSKTICDLRDAGTIYVKDWEMSQPGQKNHPRPLWDHSTNSKRQPPVNKMRPMPPTNQARLAKRRYRRAEFKSLNRYMFKMVKQTPTQGESE